MKSAGISSTLKGYLGHPELYHLLQRAMGFFRARETLVKEFLPPERNLRMLDIGCGPGHIVDLLPPEIRYEGFDTDAAYIEYAQRKFGHRGNFRNAIFEASLFAPNSFDVVTLNGVLHHMDDDVARQVLSDAAAVLKPGGTFLALDGCYRSGQSSFEKRLLDNDRGKFVRTEKAYRDLVEPFFAKTDTVLRSNIARVPYTFVYSIASTSITS